MPTGILEEDWIYVKSKNIKIEICINKNVFDNCNSLSINDLLESIRILLKYILSRKTKKVKLIKLIDKKNMFDIAPIIIVAVLGVIGNIAYFEYRLKKEHGKEIVKERLTKLLLPLYIILKTDEIELLAWNENVGFVDYESDKPDRLLKPIKNVLGKNLYLADSELQNHSLLFMEWAYGEDSNERTQKLFRGELGLERDKILDDFRELVYKKYDEQRKKYLK